MKQLLLSFINKYLTMPKVLWEFEENSVTARAVSDDKNILCEVEYKGITGENLNSYKCGVYDSNSVAKKLSVLGDNTSISLKNVDTKAISLTFTDEFNNSYKLALSDRAIIKTVPKIQTMPDDFEIVLNIDDDFVSKFSKAKSAFSDEVSCKFVCTNKDVKIVFGQTDVNMDNMIIHANVEKTSKIKDFVLNANYLRDAMAANKGQKATMQISSEGMALIKYKTEEYTASYYLFHRGDESKKDSIPTDESQF